MTAADLLAGLRARGLTVEPAGGRVRVGPADRLTDADRAAVRRLKPALLAALGGGGDGGDGGHPPPDPAGRPDPSRAYFALLSKGRAVPRSAGADLPADATYWCYPGADRWTPAGTAAGGPTDLARDG